MLIQHLRLKDTEKSKVELPSFVEDDISENKFNRTNVVKFFLPYVFPKERSRRIIMLGTLALLIFSKGLNAWIPFVLRGGINAASGVDPAYFYSGCLLGFYAVGRSVVTYTHETRNTMLSTLVQEAMKDVSTKVFSHLHTLDYTYHLTSTKSTLFAVSRSMRGVESILKFMLQHIIPTALEFILASAVLICYCGWPYLVTLGSTVSVYTVFTTRYSSIRQEQIKEQRKKNKAVDFVINESFMNYETVKAFNNEEQEKLRYGHYLSQQTEATIVTTRSLAVLNTGQQLIYNTGLGVNLLLSVANVANGTMTVGDLVMIQTIFMQLAMPLNFLGVVYRELNESQLEMRDLFALLATKSKVQELPGAPDFVYKSGKIELQGVSFSHSAHRSMLKDISLTIEPGSSVAIVGESGTGKSTLLKMIMRLFDPDSGRILIDGQDIKTVTLKSLRQSLSIVPQSTHLFNDTVLYNLNYSCPDASREQIEAVCRQVNLHDRISTLANGYDSNVGELGNKLSGGERQRIAIARALLKNAHIYMFDEFSSALDSFNEHLVSELVRTHFHNKTRIFVAHRLSSITQVDRIFVLGSEGLLETGTHESLLKVPGSHYSKLWEKFIHKEKEQ